jgi:hypothetical protein
MLRTSLLLNTVNVKEIAISFLIIQLKKVRKTYHKKEFKRSIIIFFITMFLSRDADRHWYFDVLIFKNALLFFEASFIRIRHFFLFLDDEYS